MDSNTTTPLQGTLLLVNQLELVTTTTVAGTLYGTAFTLFILYVHSLVPRVRNGDGTRQAKFMLVYSAIIILCGLYSLISNAWTTQNAYIVHSDFPKSPFHYIQTTFHSDRGIKIGLACQTAIVIMTSAIQVWRVWVIWSATRYAILVVVLPLLCFLSFTALSLRGPILRTTLTFAQVSESVSPKEDIAQIAMQATTTLLCTILISIYLILMRWRQRRLIGQSQVYALGYMNVVTILIESYSLETIWLLLQPITASHPSTVFFNESAVYIEIIAYLLVQYRVARGKSYESQREQRNISTLRWNHSDHVTVQIGEGHDGPRVLALPEASRVSSIA